MIAHSSDDQESSCLPLSRITLDPNGASELAGIRAHGVRPRLLFSLLEPIAQHLPRAITIYGSDHDLGGALLGDDQRQAAYSAIKDGRHLTEEELKKYEQRIGRVKVKGTASACPEGSLAWNLTLAAQAGVPAPPVDEGESPFSPLGPYYPFTHPSASHVLLYRFPTTDTGADLPETTFVHDALATYDFCNNPTHLRQHGAFSFDFPRDTVLRPLFQWSKHLRNPEFLATPLEAYENATSAKGMAQYTPWSEKTDSRVFWRGSSTGDSYSQVNDYRPTHWSNSHRPRLSLMAQTHEGTRRVWVKRGREWHHEQWGNGKLNQVYLDVGLTGKPHQVSGITLHLIRRAIRLTVGSVRGKTGRAMR